MLGSTAQAIERRACRCCLQDVYIIIEAISGMSGQIRDG